VEQYRLEDGTLLDHFQSARYDEHAQTISEEHLLRERDGEGNTFHEARLSMVRAWATRREMEALVRGAGFEVAELLGGFEGQPFKAESTEMVWELR